MEVEFEIGDLVTYKPYEIKLPAIVKALTYSSYGELLYYLNEPKGARKGVITYTTGRSIMESKYYIPWEEHEDYEKYKEKK